MESREAVIEAICNLEEEASDELFGTPEPIRNAFRAGVEQGFDAGYAAASQDRAWVPVDVRLPQRRSFYWVTRPDGAVQKMAFYVGAFEGPAIAWFEETEPSPYVPTKGENDDR